MYDLIGFWTATSIHVVLMLELPLVLIGICAFKVIYYAIDDKHDRYAFDRWIGKRLSKVMNTLRDMTLASGTYWVVFFLVWLYFVGDDFKGVFVPDLVHVVATVSTHAAPFVGWIGYVATVLGGLFFVARYAYRALKFKEQVQAHLNDKEKHHG